MATTGLKNLEKNWRGSDHQTTVKVAAPYYSEEKGKSAIGTLSPGRVVTYIDSLTQTHTRAAIKLDGEETVYYTNVDNLVKPKSKAATATKLGPDSFGLENRTFNSAISYYNSIKNAINSRNDIDGELFDYLYELLEYTKTGTGDYTGIKISGMPWGQVQNYYAEVIGPLACIYRNILNGIVPEGLGSAKIFMPPNSEKLYDYKIITGTHEYMISAKTAKGVSNQVKPQFVTAITKESGRLGMLQTTKEFQLLEILGSQTVVAGALYGWQKIQTSEELTSPAIASILSIYKGDSHGKKLKELPDPYMLAPFVSKHMPSRLRTIGDITIGEIRYKCEQLIQNWSKTATVNSVLKKIFNIYLDQSRVIYVKMDINKTNGNASFSASAGGGSSLVRSLYLRSSNYASRTADRIGFQVS